MEYAFVKCFKNIFYFMEDMYQEICEESKKGIKILYMRVRSKKERERDTTYYLY